MNHIKLGSFFEILNLLLVIHQGAIEGPIEFAEGVATGVLTLVGSTVGTAVGAISKITGVIGQSLATLTFDDEYQTARIRHREPTKNVVTDIATGGKNVVMVCFTLYKLRRIFI